MKDTAKVKGHAHLVRDLKSQAIVNTDSDAYARYMARKRKQKEQTDEIRGVIRDVNELKNRDARNQRLTFRYWQMADRVVAATDTLNYLRHEFNGTAADVGDIADLLSASSYIASSTDVVEAIVALNSELPEITTDAFVFPASTMVFEGATDDAFETTLSFTDPTADRTWTFPDGSGGVMLTDNADTSTVKTFTTPTITSAVINTAVSGSAVLDEDTMSSNSATKVATQQSIKAYVDNQIDTDMDLPFAGDSGGTLSIVMDSETFTIAGGTGIDTVGSGNTLTAQLSSATATLTGTQTLASKTLTSPTMNSPVFNTGVSGTAVLDEDTLNSNSATKAATQQSIKAYIDSQVRYYGFRCSGRYWH